MTDDTSHDEPDCPLRAVDRRLEDAHQLWHQAERNYFDPDAFRLAAQNTIQTLRTVTFILQKHKCIIPDFDSWYEPWQDRLRANSLMRWLVDARNKIEKEGDLESESFVRADIIASYLEEGPQIEVPARLFDNPGTLLRNIPEDTLRQHVMKNGTLRIRRRWVENTLPDHELLDALAIAYGEITQVVHDAHRQLGLPVPATVDTSTGESFEREELNGRMPCMIGHEESRTLLISLADGSILRLDRQTHHLDPSRVEEVKERYGDVHKAMAGTYENEQQLAEAYFDMVRNVFLRDGYHLPILFLFREKRLVKMTPAPAENTQQKYLIMRSLADEVIRYGADSAIFVDEVWFAPARDLAPYQRPADVETRQEALSLALVSKTNDPVQFVAMIHRDGDQVSLDDTQHLHGGALFTFAPFYSAWGRPIPDEWLTLARSVVEGDPDRSPPE